MRERHVTHDNIATPSAPVWRARYATPLTPRAVRTELAAQAMDMHEVERSTWLNACLTPLDRMLSDEEAAALEGYVLNEQILSGSARCADYAGDRVQTSRSQMTILPDDWLVTLGKHREMRKRLSKLTICVLNILCAQMEQAIDMLSPAQAGLRMGTTAKDKRQGYFEMVVEAARELVRVSR